MNSLNAAELASMESIQKYIKDHPKLKTGHTDMATESDSLDANITTTLKAGNVKGKIEVVDANDVDIAKLKMSDRIMKLLGKGIVLCRQIPTNISLENKLTRPSDYIYGAVKVNDVENATEMLAILGEKDNIKYLTNIKVTDLSEALLLVTNYDAIKDLPVQTIKAKKETGNKVVAKSVKAGRLNVANILTLGKSDWENEDPEMYEGLVAASKVIVLGVRYTPVEIAVVNDADGTAIVTAIITEQKKKKIDILYTDSLGMISLITHKAGICTFVVTAAGFVQFTLKVKIIRRVKNSFVVRMKKLIS